MAANMALFLWCSIGEVNRPLAAQPSQHHIGRETGLGPATGWRNPMQPKGKIFDDLSSLMTNAMGVAQGAKDEANNAMKSMMDRWLADRDLVTREEFDAVRTMAQKAREENAALSARIAALEAKQG
jgi:BMFP domain-containing protein YqiC